MLTLSSLLDQRHLVGWLHLILVGWRGFGQLVRNAVALALASQQAIVDGLLRQRTQFLVGTDDAHARARTTQQVVNLGERSWLAIVGQHLGEELPVGLAKGPRACQTTVIGSGFGRRYDILGLHVR